MSVDRNSKDYRLDSEVTVDSIDALKWLEYYETNWSQHEKEEVIPVLVDSIEEGFNLFFCARQYHILLTVIIGVRCGVREQCIVVDTSEKPFEADHLLVATNFRFQSIGFTFLGDLPEAAVQAKKKKDRERLKEELRRWLEEQMQVFRVDPGRACQRANNLKHDVEEVMIFKTSITPTRYSIKGQ